MTKVIEKIQSVRVHVHRWALLRKNTYFASTDNTSPNVIRRYHSDSWLPMLGNVLATLGQRRLFHQFLRGILHSKLYKGFNKPEWPILLRYTTVY